MTVDDKVSKAAPMTPVRQRDGRSSTTLAPGGHMADSRFRGGVEDVGGLLRFSGETLREIPAAIRLYPSEILHQAGRLVRENALLAIFMIFMLGLLYGLTLHYLFANLGITSYQGGQAGVATMRGPAHTPFGWIIAAKVGCGLVAQIGAMRVSEEIDAMEVMGIRPIAYLASTRVVAGLVVFPFIWISAVWAEFLGQYLVNANMLDSVSPGGFFDVLFLMHNAKDLAFSTAWATLMALAIILVGCYYGYSAKGGPLGVGHNTARSMLINMVIISVLATAMVQLFWGNDPNAGIGN